MIEEMFYLSMALVGLRVVSSKNKLLYFLRVPYEDGGKWLKWLLKPVIGCCPCMASVYGGSYVLLSGYDLFPAIEFVFGLAFMNGLLWGLYKYYHGIR